jgi:hypothetical protein
MPPVADEPHFIYLREAQRYDDELALGHPAGGTDDDGRFEGA